MTKIQKIPNLRKKLINWYQREQRPLPWRLKVTLYRTVVSEFMLQQTQIKTMLPYYERWLCSFPNFEALAHAPSDAVLKHWEGLGYYSRARNLQRLAQIYTQLPVKPTNAASWQQLPGIGPYTAAAISSIIYNQAIAVVDGNVVRILTRLGNDQKQYPNSSAAVKACSEQAQDLLDPTNPGDHNQAMMELGATICTKHNPKCHQCPLAPHCQAKNQAPEPIPKIVRKKTIHECVDRLWIQNSEALLLYRIPLDANQLVGQFELPAAEHFPQAAKTDQLLASYKRSITHRRITENIFVGKTDKISEKLKIDDNLRWVDWEKLHKLTLSGPHRRWVKALIKLSKNQSPQAEQDRS